MKTFYVLIIFPSITIKATFDNTAILLKCGQKYNFIFVNPVDVAWDFGSNLGISRIRNQL